MVITQNGIPLFAVFVESTTAIFVLIMSFFVFRKYRERRNRNTLYLAMSLFFLSLSVSLTAIGKYLDFTSAVSQDVVSYSSFTINLGYTLVAISNVFLYEFTERIFLSNRNYRKFIVTAIYGLIIGAILNSVSLSNSYSDIFTLVIFHVLLSIYIDGTLAISAFRLSRKVDDQKAKLGFRLIGLYGFFLMMVFVLFVIDTLKISFSGTTYNPEYYLAWVSGMFAALMGYLGYVMPTWFTKFAGVDDQ